LSLLGVSIAAMTKALESLKSGSIPEEMPPFDELKSVLGFEQYFEEVESRERYAEGFVADRERPEEEEEDDDDGEENDNEVEVEVIGGPGVGAGTGGDGGAATAIVLAEVVGSGEDGGGGGGSSMKKGPLKLRVTNVATGDKDLEVTLPPGVGRDVADIATFISGFGVQLKEDGGAGSGEDDFIVDSVNEGKRIQVWIADEGEF